VRALASLLDVTAWKIGATGASNCERCERDDWDWLMAMIAMMVEVMVIVYVQQRVCYIRGYSLPSLLHNLLGKLRSQRVSKG
jgi:hypothetical protein